MSDGSDNPILRPSERRDLVARVLGHAVADGDLLELACSHSSLLDAQADRAERVRRSNERLEFLGDALLDAATAELLYGRHPEADEGALSRYKSRLVSRETLARAMEERGLLPLCLVGDKMQPPWPDSVKANFAESLLAAVYKDGGWSALQVAVAGLLGDRVDRVEDLCRQHDPKGDLQDWSLRHHQALPVYDTRRDGGSDHRPSFSAVVTVGDAQAQGRGGSRQRAEADAARTLLARVSQTSTHLDESMQDDTLPPCI